MFRAHAWWSGVLIGAGVFAAEGQSMSNLRPVSREKLCVTEGSVDADGASFSVDVPKMRAYVNGWTSQAVSVRFTYRGPTAEQTRLGSGEVREQFGLKLRAQNACNLVYVMWRFAPQDEVVVSVKSNPGQTTSRECGNHGYVNLKPQHARKAPQIRPEVRPGQAHELAARIEGNGLTVRIDGREVWNGDLGPVAAEMKGPIGIRSDNVRLGFALAAGEPAGPHPHFLAACRTGPDVTD